MNLSLGLTTTRRLPLILQTEAAECALACVAMVAGYHGHSVGLAAMRRQFGVSLKGTTMKGMVDVAAGLGLHSRPLKLDMSNLDNLHLPCVLHWDMNHFVVLREIRRDCVLIHDPAIGERKLPLTSVAVHFTGVALELRPGNEFITVDERPKVRLRQLMGRVTGLRRGLAQVLILGCVLQLCTLVAPFYLQWVVDEALVAADRDLVSVLGVGFLLLVLMQTAVTAVRGWVTTIMATDLNYQWLGNAFAHMLRLPLDYFARRHLGDIVSRFNSIQIIQRSLTTQFVEAVIDGLLVLSTLVMMLLYNTLLAGIASCAILIYGVLRWLSFVPLREANAEQIIHAARQHTHFLESVRGMQGLRLYGRAAERHAEWTNKLVVQFNAELRIARIAISQQTANTLLIGAERVIVIFLGARAVIDGTFSIGMLFAFLAYKDQFSQRFAALIDRMSEWRMLYLHGERVADILLAAPEPGSPSATLEPTDTQTTPAIAFKGISYRYASGENWVLKDLNLEIPAGQCVAITGMSGCGKTTLVKLLLGLLAPESGSVLINGQPLIHFGIENLRQMTGTVMQDDTLFSGSIADNIAFFDPKPDRARMTICARMSALERDLAGMPMGLNTLVGDIGTGLSGGQQQRILLARALYRQPKLLVLDEATSHLDIWHEQAVNRAIAQLAPTRIMIAHRPETIAMAHRVIVLEGGQVTYDGPPMNLIHGQAA